MIKLIALFLAFILIIEIIAWGVTSDYDKCDSDKKGEKR